MHRGRAKLSASRWLRIRFRLLLHEEHATRSATLAIGGHPREISQEAKRYLESGLEHECRRRRSPLNNAAEVEASRFGRERRGRSRIGLVHKRLT